MKETHFEQKRYTNVLKNNQSTRFFMLACMEDDVVCEFEKLVSVKKMRKVFQERVGMTSPT